MSIRLNKVSYEKVSVKKYKEKIFSLLLSVSRSRYGSIRGRWWDSEEKSFHVTITWSLSTRMRLIELELSEEWLRSRREARDNSLKFVDHFWRHAFRSVFRWKRGFKGPRSAADRAGGANDTVKIDSVHFFIGEERTSPQIREQKVVSDRDQNDEKSRSLRWAGVDP